MISTTSKLQITVEKADQKLLWPFKCLYLGQINSQILICLLEWYSYKGNNKKGKQVRNSNKITAKSFELAYDSTMSCLK